MDSIDKATILNSINNSNADRLQKIVDRKTAEEKQTPPTVYVGQSDDGRSLVKPLGGAVTSLRTVGNVQARAGAPVRAAAGSADAGTNIRKPDSRRPEERVTDCILPGIMVHQYIPTFWQPSSFYGAFDSRLDYKEKIIWFSNYGAPVTLYELERISRNQQTGYTPEVQLANNTHFWANNDGTGQVCFQLRKVLAGDQYYDIWDLSDRGATLVSSEIAQPNTHYKGGSLGIGNTSVPPFYLLRENPLTTVSAPGGNGVITIGGQSYPTAERLPNGSLNYSLIPRQSSAYSQNLPTMAKKFAIRYSLAFNTPDIGNTNRDEYCWTINGNIAALIQEQVYSLDSNGVYVAPYWDNSGNSLVRPPNLRVGSLGSFNQNLTLNVPPFSANEHYWIESLIKPADIQTQEGLGVDLMLVGSYVNMSKNCRVRNGVTLGKTAIGRQFTAVDPNAVQ